jgi:hypothetical protein
VLDQDTQNGQHHKPNNCIAFCTMSLGEKEKTASLSLSSSDFFGQFCNVAKVVIYHRKIEPNLAMDEI